VEFAINFSINSLSGFAPFELNYGYLPQLVPFPAENAKYKGVREFAQHTHSNLEIVHDAIIKAHIKGTYQANCHRSEEPVLKIGNLAYLSTVNLNLPRRQACKLAPKYIGPFKVTKAFQETSDYELALSDELVR